MGIYNLTEATEITGENIDTILKMLSRGHLDTLALIERSTIGAAVIPAGVDRLEKKLGDYYDSFVYKSDDAIYENLLINGTYKTEFIDPAFFQDFRSGDNCVFWIELDDIYIDGHQLEHIGSIKNQYPQYYA